MITKLIGWSLENRLIVFAIAAAVLLAEPWSPCECRWMSSPTSPRRPSPSSPRRTAWRPRRSRRWSRSRSRRRSTAPPACAACARRPRSASRSSGWSSTGARTSTRPARSSTRSSSSPAHAAARGRAAGARADLVDHGRDHVHQPRPARSISPMELRTTADWVMRRRLSCPCPASPRSSPIGGDVKQYQVLVSPREAGGVTGQS